VNLPEGFARVRAGTAVRHGYEDELAGWLAIADGGPGVAPRLAASATTGRGTVYEVTLRDGGRAFVRRYVHGGLLRGVLGDVYWQRPLRPLRELIATEAARAAGVAAPEVLAAVARPARAGAVRAVLYRGVLVTRALAGRRSLASALLAARDGDERAAWLACAVDAVRALHAAGIRHPDLNAGNLLVGERPDAPAAVIDFDRATVRAAPLGALDAWRVRRRLARSLAKLRLPGLDRQGAQRALRVAGLGGTR